MKVERMKYTPVETIVCDLCESELPEPHNAVPILTRWNNEQTEGRPSKPYLETHKLDLCELCYKKYMDNIPIRAEGAQGHNKYFWNREVTE